MKLTFKVHAAVPGSWRGTIADMDRQDLKQQKFVIEAEPHETVRVNRAICLETTTPTDTRYADRGGKGQDREGKGMGIQAPKTHLLWYANLFDPPSLTVEQRAWCIHPCTHHVAGKILQDANTVESYKIEEKGFIVCMVQKVILLPPGDSVPNLILAQPKTAPSSSTTASSSAPQPPSTPAQAPASTPAPPPAPAPAASTTNAPTTPTPAAASAGGESGRFNDPSALALGSERAAAIENMEGMGFERAQIDRAMRAAFNNPYRAVEYLLSVRSPRGEDSTTHGC